MLRGLLPCSHRAPRSLWPAPIRLLSQRPGPLRASPSPRSSFHRVPVGEGERALSKPSSLCWGHLPASPRAPSSAALAQGSLSPSPSVLGQGLCESLHTALLASQEPPHALKEPSPTQGSRLCGAGSREGGSPIIQASQADPPTLGSFTRVFSPKEAPHPRQHAARRTASQGPHASPQSFHEGGAGPHPRLTPAPARAPPPTWPPWPQPGRLTSGAQRQPEQFQQLRPQLARVQAQHGGPRPGPAEQPPRSRRPAWRSAPARLR